MGSSSPGSSKLLESSGSPSSARMAWVMRCSGMRTPTVRLRGCRRRRGTSALLQKWFHVAIIRFFWILISAGRIPRQSTILTQGRLRCTQLCFHRIAGLIPASSIIKIHATRSGLHEGWVIAHMPLRIALPSYLPAQAPDWASAASTRSFIDLPFDGFLAPPSKAVMLTRILHHR